MIMNYKDMKTEMRRKYESKKLTKIMKNIHEIVASFINEKSIINP